MQKNRRFKACSLNFKQASPPVLSLDILFFVVFLFVLVHEPVCNLHHLGNIILVVIHINTSETEMEEGLFEFTALLANTSEFFP